jgi:hypothetical protein
MKVYHTGGIECEIKEINGVKKYFVKPITIVLKQGLTKKELEELVDILRNPTIYISKNERVK